MLRKLSQAILHWYSKEVWKIGEKHVRCSWNIWMGIGPLVWSWTWNYQCTFTSNPVSSLSGMLVRLRHIQTPWWPCLLPIWNGIPTLTSISTVSWYQHQLNSLILPPPPYPFSPLVAHASIMVSHFYSWWKHLFNLVLLYFPNKHSYNM